MTPANEFLPPIGIEPGRSADPLTTRGDAFSPAKKSITVEGINPWEDYKC